MEPNELNYSPKLRRVAEMKTLLLLIILAVVGCAPLTKGINTSIVYKDQHGTTVSVDGPKTHTTDTLEVYRKYKTVEYVKTLKGFDYVMFKAATNGKPPR